MAKDLYDHKALPVKDLKRAENDLTKAEAEFRRAKERLISLQVPAEELSKPLHEQKVTSRYELRSPLTGTVVERRVTPGELVGAIPDQALFTVANLDNVQVIADLYERDLELVYAGQPATVSVEAYPAVRFPAVVAAVGDVVDPNTRTIKVRARVNNEQHKLKPEMFARLNVDTAADQSVLTVPREAVLSIDGNEYVFVWEEGRYVERRVRGTATSGDLVRILEGLRHDDQVVLKGAVLLKAENLQTKWNGN